MEMMRKIVVAAYLALVSAPGYLYAAEASLQKGNALAYAQSAFLASEGTNIYIAISRGTDDAMPTYLTARSEDLAVSLFKLMAQRASLGDPTPLSSDQYLDTEVWKNILKLYVEVSPPECSGIDAFVQSYLPNLTSAFYLTDKSIFRASLNEILSPKYLERFLQGELVLHIYSGHQWISNQEPTIIKCSK